MLRNAIERLLVVAATLRLPLPKALNQRARSAYRRRVARTLLNELFSTTSLLWDSRGFWIVNPMPSETELSNYYSEQYWANRTDAQSWLRFRDVDHFLELEPFLAEIGERRHRVAINFGSGHGGCSFLFRAAGFQVWNVDPARHESGMFQHAEGIQDIEEHFDLVYASHSLEHVVNPVEVVRDLISGLSPGGIFYAEVPNARRADEMTESQPPMHPPHTVYYTTDFFRQLSLEKLILDTYDYGSNGRGTPTRSDSAEVIRFLGRKVS